MTFDAYWKQREDVGARERAMMDAILETMFRKLPERLQRRIVIDPITQCWLWTGSDSGKGKGGGYGRVSYLGCTWAVHLLVWWFVTGKPVPKGKQLDHTCNRRRCCCPEHMEVVTNAVNTKRAFVRKRRREIEQQRKQAC